VKTNKYGQIQITETEALNALYSNPALSLSNIYLDDPKLIDQYNQAREINADRLSDLNKLVNIESTVSEFDQANQKEWFMPQEYKDFNIVEFLLDKCQNQEQYTRVVEELELFVQHGMYDLLCYLKYLVDTMRKHNILWGVGRGSSVSSYVLYLIGIHKIDSLRYQLDIKEFLK